jgi:hypothetical protein
MYANDTNKLKLRSLRNEEELQFKECLPRFSSGSFVLPSAVVKQKAV